MRLPTAPKTKWFWYSMLCVLCWTAWVILQKTASKEIPEKTVQFLFAFGSLPVALVLLGARRFRLEKSPLGIFYATVIGVLAGVGNLALTAAYRTGGSTSVITAATAMYPLVTVALSLLILRERLTWLHLVGLCFAAVSFVIFST